MEKLVDWKEDYNVNIKTIDQQHRKLIDLINVAYDSIIRREDDDVLDQILSDLIDYTFIHFKNEEKYFSLLKFEDANAHIAEHQYFLKQVEKLQMEFRRLDFSVQKEIITYLQKWFTNHICKSDKKYSYTLLGAGVK